MARGNRNTNGKKSKGDHTKEPVESSEDELPSFGYSVELTVSPKHFKRVIGKGSSNINKLKTEYKVNVIPAEDTKDKIRIQGLESEVAKAKSELQKIIAKFDSEIELPMEIKQEFHRMIIGDKGEQIRDIQNRFKAIVKFPSETQTEGVDTVLISGPKENVLNCRCHLYSLMRNLSYKNYTSKMPIYKPFKEYITNEGELIINEIERETKTKIKLCSDGDEENNLLVIGIKENAKKATDQLDKIQNAMECVINVDVKIATKYQESLNKDEITTNIKRDCGNVAIKFPSSSANSELVVIRGPVEDATEAKQRLLKALLELKTKNFSVNVKAKLVDYQFLTGKGNYYIQRLTNMFNVHVMFPEDSLMDKNVIKIIGRRMGVNEAVLELNRIMAEINKLAEEEVEADPAHVEVLLTRSSQKSVIQQIIDDAGGDGRVQFSFEKSNQNGPVVVAIKGYECSVKMAKQLFIEKLDRVKSSVTVYIELDDISLAMLSSDKRQIEAIAEEFDVSFELKNIKRSKKHKRNRNGKKSGELYGNFIVVTGPPENCAQAKTAILEEVFGIVEDKEKEETVAEAQNETSARTSSHI